MNRRNTRWSSVVALSALLLAGSTSGSAAAEDLQTILARFDEVQQAFTTLSAKFSETTSNDLLAEPMVADGRFYMTKPDSIRWEYERPEAMRFVITHDQYTGYFPERKQAETRNISRWSGRLFRFIGLGQVSSELEKLYDIRLEHAAESPDGTHVLVFEPKKGKRRVRKAVEDVRFWVDARSYLPTRVEYQGANGHKRTIEFSEIRLNPDLSAALYQVELPPDVKVTKGFGSLPGLGDDDEATQTDGR